MGENSGSAAGALRATLRLPTGIRGVVFDVGETLVDETRMWTEQADRAGVTPFTLMGVLGALIARGDDHTGAWSLLGVQAPEAREGIRHVDLYPDAVACIDAAREAGLVVGIAGNQPEAAEAELRTLGVVADFIPSLRRWGVAKPSPAFFERTVSEAGLSASTILYVGDRLDNDVLPAKAAGLRTALLRRGPWGVLHALEPEANLADLRLESLAELSAAFEALAPSS